MRGFMSTSGLRYYLEFIDETVNAVKYQAILQNNVSPIIGKLSGIDVYFILKEDGCFMLY